ncbi:COMM domain-containing protein 5 [Pocillopora verrucosa]|uniref:COMM domain-containing protein 5 n=1 Tax=Pocillopora verrucosa TaxID=203993 RepID=UPI0027973F60|nr:COMM domain-containing protein 5-like [Pocillopora verrucosa]
MARERASSALTPLTETTLFVGPKIPDEIKRMIPHLTKIDKALFRKILQVIISVLEGKVPDDGLLQKLQSETVTEDVISSLYAGLYSLLRSALRLPQTSLKPEQFKADLGELKIPTELIPDLSSIVFGEKRPAFDAAALQNRNHLPTLDSLRWRVDVAISTSALNRVLEPTVLMELKLSDGKVHTFEVSLSKFHELRYNVAYVLKEMEEIEKKSILKIQD